MKNLRMFLSSLAGLVLFIIIFGGMIYAVNTAPVPVQPTPTAVPPTPTLDPMAPVTYSFNGGEPHTVDGKEGLFRIDCGESHVFRGLVSESERCKIVILTDTVCTDAQGKTVEPTFTVTHDGQVTSSRAFSDNAVGEWIVKSDLINYVANSSGEYASCKADVKVTVSFPENWGEVYYSPSFR